MAVELDYMEYATHLLAQTAYPTSDEHSDTDVSGGQSYDCSCSEGPSYAVERVFDDDEGTFWCTNYCDHMGTDHWVGVDFGSGNEKIIVKVRIKSTGYGVVKNFKIYGSNTSFIADLVELYSGSHADNSNWETYTFSNNVAYRYYVIYVVDTYDTFITIGEAEMMENSLQCYSENVIKEQGSYSLKVFAKQTDALNDILTRTVSPTIDLSGQPRVYLYIRASREGSNIKIGFHDSGGVTTEVTPNVTSANTWQLVEVDISSVADADKDAIDSIIITIVNADSDNVFYLDDMYGSLIVVSKERNIVYDLFAYIAKERNIVYDLVLELSKTRNIIYDSELELSREQNIVYDSVLEVSKTRSIVYDSILELSKERDILYDLILELSKERNIRYDSELELSQERNIVYNLFREAYVTNLIKKLIHLMDIED